MGLPVALLDLPLDFGAESERRIFGVRSDRLEVRPHQRVVLRIVEQEGVVPVGRVDLRVTDVAAAIDQRLDDLARARRWEAPIGRERDDQELARGRGKRAREVAFGGERGIEVIERLGDAQVGIRIVVLGEFFALVAQVGLDLELRGEGKLEALAQSAAEPLLHLQIGQIRDVAEHARHAQAASRQRALRREVALMKIRVGQDRLSRDLVERDVLRRQIGRGRDQQRVADSLRITNGPCKRLHAAEASAHHCGELRNAQTIREPRLRIDPVFDGDQRKIAAPRTPGVRIDRLRTR